MRSGTGVAGAAAGFGEGSQCTEAAAVVQGAQCTAVVAERPGSLLVGERAHGQPEERKTVRTVKDQGGHYCPLVSNY